MSDFDDAFEAVGHFPDEQIAERFPYGGTRIIESNAVDAIDRHAASYPRLLCGIRDNATIRGVFHVLKWVEDSLDFDAADVIPTTYGALAPGQPYRLPGGKRWYHRSSKEKITDGMRERAVEIVSESR